MVQEDSCVSTVLHCLNLSNNTNRQAMILPKLFSYATRMQARHDKPTRRTKTAPVKKVAQVPAGILGYLEEVEVASEVTVVNLAQLYWRSLAVLSAARNLCSLSCCMASFVSCANLLQSSPYNTTVHLCKKHTTSQNDQKRTVHICGALPIFIHSSTLVRCY
jgi:hypothetical protein